MENAPVHRVFDQSPDEKTEGEQSCRGPNRQGPLGDREMEQVADHWQVDHQGRHRVNMGEKLHEIGLEHSDRFVFVGDVTLRHTLYLAEFRAAIKRA